MTGSLELNTLLTTDQPILLEQIQILNAETLEYGDRLDLWLDSNRHIRFDHEALPPETTRLDASQLILGNGLIDLYSTCGEPGFEQRETWASLSNSARQGGFVQVGVLPHTLPILDSLATLEYMSGQAPPNLMPWAAITKGCLGKELTELAELAPRVLGFTDARPIANLGLLRQLLDYAQPLAKPIMLWVYDLSLAGAGVIREGKWSVSFGMTGVPAIAETTAIAALVELVKLTRTPVHLMRISTARGVELISQAQDQGLPISASVGWHHLVHETQELASYDPNLRLEPPLGDANDRQALIEGIRTGVIAAIAIDHTAHTYEEKAQAFELAAPGAIGLEFALPVLWQSLVKTGKLTALELWQSLSSRPAQILGIPTPRLGTIFSPKTSWQVKSQHLASLSANSVYLNQSLWGRAIALN